MCLWVCLLGLHLLCGWLQLLCLGLVWKVDVIAVGVGVGNCDWSFVFMVWFVRCVALALWIGRCLIDVKHFSI